jgi:hypothetical protein
MVFADIDWNRVLMQGLIGGVIGGVIGLILFLFKKKGGGDKPRADEDAASRRSTDRSEDSRQ